MGINRNLVVVRADQDSLHTKFLGDLETRSWDILVSCYSGDPTLFRDLGQERVDDLALSAPALYALFTQRLNAWALKYDYIWLCADDILTDQASVNKLFSLCNKYSLDLAQPAMSLQSVDPSHEITKVQVGSVLRYTTFVESLCPCFSYEGLLRCWSTYGLNQTGYGIDYLWPQLITPPLKMAIVDAVSMTHTRRRGKLYRRFETLGLDPMKDAQDLVARENLTPTRLVTGQIFSLTEEQDAH